MTLRTVTYDDSTHKIVPIEATEAQLDIFQDKLLCFGIEPSWDSLSIIFKNLIAAAPEVEPIEMPEDLQRDWKGIDGAIAYHLIDRHADNWGDVGQMMDAWLKANQSAPEYQEPVKDE